MRTGRPASSRTTLPVDYEFRVLWPDGSVHWLASRSVAVCGSDGRPVRRIGVNWDITDARSAVIAREEKAAAQREVQAKSQFLARMSHELRTPLNAVLGFTQLLMGDGERAGAASRQRRLAHIRSAGQHLLSLIDDVLDLSRLEGGEVTIEIAPTALRPLVEQVLPLVEPLMREHGVSVVTAEIDVVPMADPTRLRQVLLNLLTNAVKYNRSGGSVTIAAEASDGVVLIRVVDSGRGMTPEQQRHLFEPFNRLGAEASAVEGTGIGLAIVKALVERMGGTVEVTSSAGIGSAFVLCLRDGAHAPPAPEEVASPQALALAATAGQVGAGGTVLYIEDNPVNAMIVAELLARRSDLSLHIAVDGLSGLALAAQVKPDLVLLDMQLPDIDGHQVFDRLQADRATASIPCIALSANAMPADIDRALRLGFSDYWTKPLDFRAFMASIDALFGPAPE
jgi:signal transduction histidine kinase/CheY-like chemotaxis protein